MTRLKHAVIAGLLLIVFIAPPALYAEDESATLESLAKKTDDLSRKTAELLKNQQDIISQLKDIKNELTIIKVRATQ